MSLYHQFRMQINFSTILIQLNQNKNGEREKERIAAKEGKGMFTTS